MVNKNSELKRTLSRTIVQWEDTFIKATYLWQPLWCSLYRICIVKDFKATNGNCLEKMIYLVNVLCNTKQLNILNTPIIIKQLNILNIPIITNELNVVNTPIIITTECLRL